MAISRSQSFVSRLLPAGRLHAAIIYAFEAVGLPAPEDFNVSRKLADGSDTDRIVRADELETICDLREPGLDIRASAGSPGPTTWHYFAVYAGKPGGASVHVQAPNAAALETMITAFMSAAELDRFVEPHPEGGNPEPVVPPSVAPVIASPGPPARMRAFLSFRFGKPDNDAMAAYVERLLGLLEVEVITGRSYEPRPVGNKVAERLNGLDLLVVIIGADGESAWTRDEIATARANGVPVIPLVAAESAFEPGLFGDLEYITFDPAHPGDVSTPLIEGIAFVRRTRDT